MSYFPLNLNCFDVSGLQKLKESVADVQSFLLETLLERESSSLFEQRWRGKGTSLLLHFQSYGLRCSCTFDVEVDDRGEGGLWLSFFNCLKQTLMCSH